MHSNYYLLNQESNYMVNTRKVLGIAIAITLLGVGVYLCAYGAYEMWSWNEYVEYCTGGRQWEADGFDCIIPEGGYLSETLKTKALFMVLTFIGSLFLVAGGVILIVLKKKGTKV